MSDPSHIEMTEIVNSKAGTVSNAPPLRIEQFQQDVARIAAAHEFQVFAVGGYVRDCVMGRTPYDLDLLALGDGIQFARIVADKLNLPKPVEFNKFDTARLIFRNAHVEVIGVGMQTDEDPAPGPENLDIRLRRDLARRDFTVNAMALPLLETGQDSIVDLFDGQGDIQRGIIKTPLPPAITLTTDPIRLMRAIRFAAQLDFQIEETAWQTICQAAAAVHNTSQERITEELLKMLALSKPSEAFALLKSSGLLVIILQEIDALSGVEIVDGKGHKDVLLHTLQVVDNVAKVSENIALRFAALMHDVAKPRTKKFEPAAGWTFHGHDDFGARMTGRIARRLKLPKVFSEYAQKMVRHHLRPIHLADEGVTDSAVRRLSVLLEDDLDDLMLLCRADITSKNPRRVRRHLANFDLVCERVEVVKDKDELRNFHSPVTGEEIMRECKIEPGPVIGRIKRQIEDAILQGDIPNEHDAAFDYFLQIKDAIIDTTE
jgi:poly(A) polymerase